MPCPLVMMVELLRPSDTFSKIAEAVGAWRVRRVEAHRPFYCAVLEGTCRFQIEGRAPMLLEKGDFLLAPTSDPFTIESVESPAADSPNPIELRPGLFRFGDIAAPAEVRMMIGYSAFDATDAPLLLSLLPPVLHVRGEERLVTLVRLLNEEVRARRGGGEAIVARLVELMLLEALRATPDPLGPPGLLRGLADERLAGALRRMHDQPTWPWTVAELAREAALSRSTFFERFRASVGVAPMEYLLQWRMALAKDMLRRGVGGIAEIAEQVGYRSASTFSVAFARHVGLPPTRYAKAVG